MVYYKTFTKNVLRWLQMKTSIRLNEEKQKVINDRAYAIKIAYDYLTLFEIIVKTIENNKILKKNKEIKKRNNNYKIYKKNKCFMCGYDKCKNSLHVHHIDLNHENNDENNLITLCANCHGEIHSNKYKGDLIANRKKSI